MILQTLELRQENVIQLVGLELPPDSVQLRHRARTQDLKLFELKAKWNDEPNNKFRLQKANQQKRHY